MRMISGSLRLPIGCDDHCCKIRISSDRRDVSSERYRYRYGASWRRLLILLVTTAFVWFDASTSTPLGVLVSSLPCLPSFIVPLPVPAARNTKWGVARLHQAKPLESEESNRGRKEPRIQPHVTGIVTGSNAHTWMSSSTSRHEFIAAASLFTAMFAFRPEGVKAAIAAVDTVTAAAAAALEALRTEVTSSTGGIAYLKSRVEQADYPALLEYTKTYDPILRKVILKRAKKLILVTPEQNERATLLSNAVSFDLIGINKSARPGQESQENAARYLRELEQDLSSYIALLVEASY